MDYCFSCGTGELEITAYAFGGIGVGYKCSNCEREFKITRDHNTFKVTSITVTKQPRER